MRAKSFVLAGLLAAAGLLGTAGKADAQFGLGYGAYNAPVFGAYDNYYGYSPFVSYPSAFGYSPYNYGGLGLYGGGVGVPTFYNRYYNYYTPFGGRSFGQYNYYNPGFGPGVYNYRFGRFR